MDRCDGTRAEHHWPTARARALELAGHACARCGTTEGLQVHHVEPAHGNRAWGCVHHQANLVVLCGRCHVGEHEWLQLASGRSVAVRQLALPFAA